MIKMIFYFTITIIEITRVSTRERITCLARKLVLVTTERFGSKPPGQGTAQSVLLQEFIKGQKERCDWLHSEPVGEEGACDWLIRDSTACARIMIDRSLSGHRCLPLCLL